MAEHEDYTEVRRARTPFEAQILAGILHEAGIPTYVQGGMLADEFATSQRLMNLQSVQVLVPANAVQAAEEALAEADAAGALMAREAELAEAAEREQQQQRPDEPGAGGGRRWLTWLLAGIAVGLGLMWIDTRARLADATRGDPNFVVEMGQGGVRIYRWRDNRRIAVRMTDANRNGIFERTEVFDRRGMRCYEMFDDDENGLPERSIAYDSDGEILRRLFDDDQDRRIDRQVELWPRGFEGHWSDPDGDGHLERRELRGPDGKVIRVDEDRGPRGFVQVR